jgi:hypothetical protein
MRAATTMNRRQFVLGAAMAPAMAAEGATTPCNQLLADHATEVLVLIVDRTHVRSNSFNERMLDAVANAVRPGVRVLAFSFGGEGARALPEKAFELMFPIATKAKPTLEGLARAAMAPYTPGAADACEREEFNKIRPLLLGLVQRELVIYDGSPKAHSPVLLALNTALTPLIRQRNGLRINAVVISDMLEHTPALSLYATPMPTREAAVQKANQLFPADWRGVHFYISGMGNTPTGDAATVTALSQIWNAIILSRHAIPVELSPSVPQGRDWVR